MYVAHVKMLCLKFNFFIYISNNVTLIFIEKFNPIVNYTFIYIQLKGVLTYYGS